MPCAIQVPETCLLGPPIQMQGSILIRISKNGRRLASNGELSLKNFVILIRSA